VVIGSGSLATAMRATMSLPGVFPPVSREGRVLVDGGVRTTFRPTSSASWERRRVIAIDVGYAPDDTVNYSMFGLLGRTVDAMMRTSTRAALAHADMTIAIDVQASDRSTGGGPTS
jgi:NTE family protein